jgi:hypothetical protein
VTIFRAIEITDSDSDDELIETEEQIQRRLDQELFEEIQAGIIPSLEGTGITWEDLGGFEEVKQRVTERVQGFPKL